MATIEDFILRFKTVGTAGIKQAGSAISGLKDDVNNFAQAGGPLGNTLNGIVGKLGPVGLAAGVVATAFVALGSKALSLANELSDISGATGIAAGTLMNFRQSVIEAGGKMEDASEIVFKLNRNIQEAASGNETFQKSFRNLGVFVTDANGKVRDTEDIFADIIERLKEGSLSASQQAAAFDILGKNLSKLEFSKLQYLKDPFKDEQIKQLDKFNEAIDKLTGRINDYLITAFGSLAIAINEGGISAGLGIIIEGLTNLSAEILNLPTDYLAKFLNLFGTNIQNPVGLGTPLQLLAEQAKKDRLKFQAEAVAARKAKEDADRKLRQQSGPAGTDPKGPAGGGFGKTPEADLKAVAEYEKRIASTRADIQRQEQLKANTERLSALLLFADKQSAIEEKSNADIKAIEINTEAEIAKAKESIYNQERLSRAQKENEYILKSKELNLKAEADIAAVKERTSEALRAEQERIKDIIRTSQARTQEEQELNNQLKERNELLNATLGDTDRERNNLQELVDIEGKREEILRRIRQIQGLPDNARAAEEERINKIFEERLEITRQQQEQDLKNQENFSKGFEKAFRTYAESAKNNFETAGRIFEKITQGMEDSIVDFAKTGKFEFRGFINSVLEELLRSQVRSLIAQTFGGLFGSTSKRGTVTIGDIIPGFAAGGLIGTNGPVIVGERGPELLVGAGGNRVIPNNELASGSVTYNISAVDAQSFKQLVASDPSFIYAVTEQGRRTIPSGRR
jgi:lambda family phage tail tape measure protein